MNQKKDPAILEAIFSEVGQYHIVDLCDKNNISTRTFYKWLELPEFIEYKDRYIKLKHTTNKHNMSKTFDVARHKLFEAVQASYFPAIKLALEQEKVFIEGYKAEYKDVILRTIYDIILNSTLDNKVELVKLIREKENDMD